MSLGDNDKEEYARIAAKKARSPRSRSTSPSKTDVSTVKDVTPKPAPTQEELSAQQKIADDIRANADRATKAAETATDALKKAQVLNEETRKLAAAEKATRDAEAAKAQAKLKTPTQPITPTSTSAQPIQSNQTQQANNVLNSFNANTRDGSNLNSSSMSSDSQTLQQQTPHYASKTQAANAENSNTSVNSTSSHVFSKEEIEQIKANVSKYHCKAEFNDDGTAKSVRGTNPIKAVINSGNSKFKQGAFTLNFDININWNDQKAVENLQKKINTQLAEATEGGVAITKITINGQPADSQIIEVNNPSKSNAMHPNAIQGIMLSPPPSHDAAPTSPIKKKPGGN